LDFRIPIPEFGTGGKEAIVAANNARLKAQGDQEYEHSASVRPAGEQKLVAPGK
jgi:hypothetical protein